MVGAFSRPALCGSTARISIIAAFSTAHTRNGGSAATRSLQSYSALGTELAGARDLFDVTMVRAAAAAEHIDLWMQMEPLGVLGPLFDGIAIVQGQLA
jgi:hypothetical protein